MGVEAVVGVEVVVADDKYCSLDNGLTSLHHDNHACACSFSRPKAAYAANFQWGFHGFLGSISFWFFFLRAFSFLVPHIAPLAYTRSYPLNHNWEDKESLQVEKKC